MLPTWDASLIFLNKDHEVQEWGFGDFVVVLLFDVTISYCCQLLFQIYPVNFITGL